MLKGFSISQHGSVLVLYRHTEDKKGLHVSPIAAFTGCDLHAQKWRDEQVAKVKELGFDLK